MRTPEELSEYYILEIGHNGASISDVKEVVEVSAENCNWLVNMLYAAFYDQQYNSGFINVIGENEDRVTVRQCPTGRKEVRNITLPKPLVK